VNLRSVVWKLIYVLVGMVAVAATIRITWELLEPVLVPVGLLVLVGVVVYLAVRRFR
jgi:hypothetical protein